MRLTKKARRGLRATRRVKVSLHLTMTAPTGAPFILTRSVTLER